MVILCTPTRTLKHPEYSTLDNYLLCLPTLVIIMQSSLLKIHHLLCLRCFSSIADLLRICKIRLEACMIIFCFFLLLREMLCGCLWHLLMWREPSPNTSIFSVAEGRHLQRRKPRDLLLMLCCNGELHRPISREENKYSSINVSFVLTSFFLLYTTQVSTY